jgi:hypothetical protein
VGLDRGYIVGLDRGYLIDSHDVPPVGVVHLALEGQREKQNQLVLVPVPEAEVARRK